MNKDEECAAARATAIAAGVTADEMRDDPEYGLLISPSGVRKTAAMAADTKAKMEMLALVERVAPLKTS